jgi:hypothetical protein
MINLILSALAEDNLEKYSEICVLGSLEEIDVKLLRTTLLESPKDRSCTHA